MTSAMENPFQMLKQAGYWLAYAAMTAFGLALTGAIVYGILYQLTRLF